MAKRKTSAATQDEKIISFIKGKFDDAEAHTSTWRAKQVKWHKIRMRIKKTKSSPFVGCSNIRMPTAETKIRKLKASLVSVIFGMRPVASVVPTPSGNWNSAHKIEKFLDHLIMDVIKLRSKAIIAIDRTLEKGFYLLKPFWRLEITKRKEEFSWDDVSEQERLMLKVVIKENKDMARQIVLKELIKKLSVDLNPLVYKENIAVCKEAVEEIMGRKKKITLQVQDVIWDYPDVALCDPEYVPVPADSGYYPQDLEFIPHEFYLPLRQLKTNARLKGWSKPDIDDIELKKNVDLKSKRIDITKDTREGIERLKASGELVKIQEAYCWYDLNKDGEDEKCLFTIAPQFNKVLRKITLPFFTGKWPFVKLFYELTDDRWFSHRGLPELLEDVIKEIDIQHMQKIDQQTVRNTPLFLYRSGMINPNLLKFGLPNTGIPVHGMQPLNDSLAALNLQNPNVEYSYEKEQMLLETKIEELVGQVDFSLHSMINKRQPRTLGEVQMQWQSGQLVFSLDSDMMRESFGELFEFIWALWCQYGQDNYEFAYFGQNGWEKIKLNKEEIQGKYKISIRGNDQNVNPQVKLQKANQILQAAINPQLQSMNVVTPINAANALKRFYQTLDVADWQELINMQPQPAPNPELIKRTATQIKNLDLTQPEKAQLLKYLGIQPDMQGRVAQKQYSLAKEAAELGT